MRGPFSLIHGHAGTTSGCRRAAAAVVAAVLGFGLLGGGGVARQARAQSIDDALGLYKSQSYENAAFAFYDIMAHDANPDRRDQAQIYLAETLRKMELYTPALFYYQDIFKAGRSNRYYLNALEGLLALQETLHDPVFIPILVDKYFDAEGFGKLEPARIAQINYLVGEFSFRRNKNDDAKLFLEYVPPESRYYQKARYLLGVLAVRRKDQEGALAHFKSIIDHVDAATESGESGAADPDKAELKNLALVAAGRVAYGLGRYVESFDYYGQVPRYSEQWFSSLYESAWAHFRAAAAPPADVDPQVFASQEYGKALGELTSVLSPFFAKHHVPEAYVIQGTAYFLNCQWDRVRRSVEAYKGTYRPMAAELKSYLEAQQAPGEIYRDVVAGGNGRFALELAREVRRSKRFKDYYFMLTHMAWERQHVTGIERWRGTELAEVAAAIIDTQRDQLEPVVGSWAKRRLTFLLDQLNNFDAQVKRLDVELSDAERMWLDQGKEILKGRRARLPRPEIPNDQWQHWSFDREYWRDEAGYFQHSLRSECF